ncbi:hypothetical protein X762_21690 [Mesorhizobium sp. LSHC426A00]|nr:hypothetical protein X762_21690 [Mesorhizobium sp. LSHC426A00]ESX54453.1 hypothetical protein X761_16550 [Mesorhizobium sp. LSHC424B00]ESX72378.1 hypothetical protein X758_14870 [Mesorhizobium sp. LSHC416B00]
MQHHPIHDCSFLLLHHRIRRNDGIRRVEACLAEQEVDGGGSMVTFRQLNDRCDLGLFSNAKLGANFRGVSR